MSRPEKWKDEYRSIAERACKLGATDQDLADMFEVSLRTIYNWRATKPEFVEALKFGKDEADARVERSLYQRAVGYSHSAVKIFMPAGATKPVMAEYVEHHAPDPTSMIFWLKNRKSDEWRDRQELTGKDGSPLIPVALTEQEIDARLMELMAAKPKGLNGKGNGKANGHEGNGSAV